MSSKLKAIIVYASQKGATSKMADIIAAGLEKEGHSVLIRHVFEAKVEELPSYDLILLGSSTWANGDLHRDFVDFERDMEEQDLSGSFASTFGSGSTRFPFFCEAVEILEARLRSQGAKFLGKNLKSDELQRRTAEDTSEWTENLIRLLNKRLK
jgi:flavodoxin I